MAEDPRTHITPDAFSVAPELLGYALARPLRRLFAIAIDLALAALIARTGIEYLIAAAAALLAWRAIGGPAERWLAGRGRLVFRAASAVLALIVVINIWDAAADRIRHLQEQVGSPAGGAPGDAGASVDVALEDLHLSAADQGFFVLRFASLQLADERSAGEKGAELGRWVREKTSPGEERDEFVEALASAMTPPASTAFLQEVSGVASADSPAQSGPATESVPAAETGARAAGPADSAPGSGDSARADSVAQLAAATARLLQRNETLRGELDELRDERNAGGFRAWAGRISDDLGLGFGWFALYFTAFTVLGRGQTPGKRLLRIKVLRLDNRPLGWWLAFERFGGYAASFSIGLLGFAQVFWDRNRQALHDKAVGTVVVMLRGGQPYRIT